MINQLDVKGEGNRGPDLSSYYSRHFDRCLIYFLTSEQKPRYLYNEGPIAEGDSSQGSSVNKG